MHSRGIEKDIRECLHGLPCIPGWIGASCCLEAVHGAAGEPDVPGHGDESFELPQRWL